MRKKLIPFLIFSWACFLSMQSSAFCLPSGEKVLQGKVSFERNEAAHSLTIKIENSAIVEFDSFNISGNETVSIITPSPQTAFEIRITGTGTTQISGLLTVNSDLNLINRGGFAFSQTGFLNRSRINTRILNRSERFSSLPILASVNADGHKSRISQTSLAVAFQNTRVNSPGVLAAALLILLGMLLAAGRRKKTGALLDLGVNRRSPLRTEIFLNFSSAAETITFFSFMSPPLSPPPEEKRILKKGEGCPRFFAQLKNYTPDIKVKALGKVMKKTWVGSLCVVYLTFPVFAGLVYGLPTEEQVVSGEAIFERADTSLNVTAGDNTIIEWGSFDIGQAESVNFTLPSVDASLLNRIVGGGTSQILGRITANGSLVLVNQNGFYFGPSAQVNAGNLIASTHDITNGNYLGGNYLFAGLGDTVESSRSSILNEGTLHASGTGGAVLIADAIENRGVIEAPIGKVALAAGDTVAVQINADGWMVAVDEATAHQILDKDGSPISEQVKNSGTLAGGTVQINAQAADQIFESAINLEGIVQATDMVVGEDGSIEIMGSDDIQVNSAMTADQDDIEIAGDEAVTIAGGSYDAPNGNVEVSARTVLTVSGDTTTTGHTTFEAKDNIAINADVTTDSGNLTFQADSDLNGEGSFLQASGTMIKTTTSGDITISSSGESTVGNIVSAGDLTLSKAGAEAYYTQLAGSTVTTAGSLTINDDVTLLAGNTTYGVSRDWVNLGNFDAQLSLVQLVGIQDSVVLGSNTFNDFQVIEPGKLVRFDSDAEQQVLGTLTLRGSYGNLLLLRSTEPGMAWKINAVGVTELSYLDIMDSSNINIHGPPLSASYSSNSPGNIGWEFPAVSADEILTPSGWRLLSELQTGDEVVAFNSNGERIINLFERSQTLSNLNNSEDPFTFYLINGQYKLYKNQSIWANNRVVHAFEIEMGDTLYTDSNQGFQVTSIEALNNETEWTTLTISGNHTYVAGGLMLHNASRYWVGGGSSSNWSATANTNWGSASNTQDNASVPVSSDDVFFDGVGTGASNSTLSANITIRSLNMTGYANTLTHDAAVTLSIGDGTAGAGNNALIFSAGMTYTKGSATTSSISFISTSATVQNVNINGKTAGNVTFDGVSGSWILQEHLTAASLTLTNGTLNDNAKTVTVNGNISITGTLTSTGTWIQGANGNISNSTSANKFSTLQIANSVTSTRTADVYAKNLVLGTNAVLTGSGGIVLLPTANDFLDMGSGSSITTGGLFIWPASGTLTQKAFSVGVNVDIAYAASSTIQMTGHWTTGRLVVHGQTTSTSEGTALVLDTNGYNLTVNGDLAVGLQFTGQPNGYQGKILFQNGTHAITGNMSLYVVSAETTVAYLNFGSSNISVGGSIDFTSLTVTPGTSNVTITGSSLTSAAQSFFNLTVQTDSDFAINDAMSGTGALIIKPASVGTTMELGGTTKTLNLSATEMGRITAGWSSQTFGRTDGTGAILVDANTFSDITNIYGGDITTGGTIVPVKNLTFGSTGNVTISNAITKSSGADATLTINANGNISTSAAISSSNNELNILFNSDRDANSSGYISVAAAITSNGGDITLGGGSGTISAGSGYAEGNAGQAYGVYINSVAVAAGGGNIIVNGKGYNTTTNGNLGVLVQGASATLSTTGTGTITINGIGQGITNSNSDYGVLVSSGGIISTVNGALTIVGTGGGAGSGGTNIGVFVNGTNSTIKTTGSGNISVTGTGGNVSGSGAINAGIYVTATNGIQTTGTGHITIVGVGGNGGGSGATNIGVALDGAGSITGASGSNISITGTGGNSSGNTNYGVYFNWAGIAVSTSGAGTITIQGTGSGNTNSASNFGVLVNSGAIISSVDGNLTVTGTGGGAGAGTDNYGVYILAANSTIKTTGSGNIILTGIRGGGDTNNNYGLVMLVANGIQTTGTGNITVSTDTIYLQESNDINSVGNLTIYPYTTSTTVGVGSGSGTLALSSAYIGYLNWGSSSTLTIGDTTKTGAMAINYTAAWSKAVSFITGAASSDITVSGTINTTYSGALLLSSRRNIILSSEISASTNPLNITLKADNAAGNSGYINVAAAITSNGGSITMGGGSGTISAGSGYAEGNSGQSTGILINNVAVAAGGGNIIVNGKGYNTTTNGNHGVYVVGGSAAFTTTGTGTITINGIGQGTSNSASNYGVLLDAGSIFSSVNGNLTVVGTGGGAGSGTGNYGVWVTGTNSTIKTTGSGNVSVTGTGGNASGSGGSNLGVVASVPNSIQTTGSGSLTVIGTGGNGGGSGGSNMGVVVLAGASITGASGSNVSVTGTGGNSSGIRNIGINVTGAGAMISASGSGTLTLQGTGSGNTNSNSDYAIEIDTGGVVSSVDGNLTVNNSVAGGAGSGGSNFGVFITGSNSTIKTTGTGNIIITGTGGNPNGSGSGNYGVFVNASNGIQTTGTGNITITGTGGNGNGSGQLNYGVYVDAGNSITGASGSNVSVTGTGGNGTGGTSIGIRVTGAGAAITASGSGTLTLQGTGAGTSNSDSDFGIEVDTGGIVSSVDGTLTVTGTGGGAGAGTSNYGVYITGASSTIKTTGTGNIILTGVRGGGDTATNYGLRVAVANGIQTTGTGNITISTDTILLAESNDINSVGNLTIYPYTVATTVGVGSGSGTLALSSAYIGYLNWGSSSTLTIGDTTKTGAMAINYTTAWSKAVSFITGAASSDITVSGTINTTYSGALLLSSRRNIILSSGISASTNPLNITLKADNAAGNSGYINVAAAITSNGGSITMGGGSGTISAGSGYAEGNSGQAYGVYINNVAVAAGGGNIIVNGKGYNTTTDNNYGVYVTGASGTLSTTGTGAITINGIGQGTGNSATSYGVYVVSGAIISTVNGALTVVGTGGGAGSGVNNDGVRVAGANSTIKTTGSGNISVTGNGGNASGSGSSNYGVTVLIANGIQTTGTGTITIVGTGGGAGGSGGTNNGVYVIGSITGCSGCNVSVTGTGGNSSGNSNYGVAVDGASAVISASGSGTLTISGTSTGSGNSAGGHGVLVNNGGIISSVDGTLTITATGGGAGSGTSNFGVYVLATNSTIKTTGSGNISITATGGNAAGSGNLNVGVYVTSANGIQTTGTGNITITGTGGNGSGSAGNSWGVYVDAGHSITGASGSNVSITGIGGNSSGDSNFGVLVDGASAEIKTSGSGTVTIIGTGGGSGNSSTNYGVLVNNGGVISSVDGTLTVTGTGGGAGVGSANRGIIIFAASSTIKTTGSGNIILTGIRGGGSGGSNDGLYVGAANGIQTSGTGNITVSTDTIYLQESNDINSVGNLTIYPYTVATTVGVGSGSGTLALSSAYIGYLNWGSSSTLTIGDTTKTGAMAINYTTAWSKAVSFITGAASSDITVSGTINTTYSGALLLSSRRNIILSSGISASTNPLNITLKADNAAGNSGYINVAAAITSNGGSITMGGGSGTISAGSGYAEGNSGQAYGVYINNVAVAAGGGNIIVNGRGYNTTTDSNIGVRVTGGSGALTTTGSGTITISGIGQGSSNSGADYGVQVDTAGVISTVNGNLTISNTTGGGAGAGTGNYGVTIEGVSIIRTTGSGNISISGTGGNASGSGGDNTGVRINGSTVETTGTGTIAIVGTGGNGTGGSGGNNTGVYVKSGATITGCSGCNVSITGTGGNSSGNGNYGVYVSDSATISTSGAGTMTVQGTGSGSGNSGTNRGITLDTGGVISSANGTLTVTGDGGGAGSGEYNYGVVIENSNTTIKTTGSGNVIVTGTGSNASGSGDYNMGVVVISANGIQATGTGDITVTGTGGNASGGNNHGVYVDTGHSITGASGHNVSVTGTGGNSSGNNNFGVYVTGAGAVISTSGSGTLTVVGTGGGNTNSARNYGVRLQNGGVVSSVDGALTVTGTGGGGGAGTDNYGFYITDANSTIKTTGSGNIILTGIRGGGDTATNYGLRVAVANGLQTTSSGNITVSTDTILLAESNDINSIANLTVKPYTASTTIGVGAGAGTLSLTDAYLGYLTWGTVAGGYSLTIGSTTAGDIAINSSSTILNKNVNFISGGNITLATTTLAHAGATASTLNMYAYGNITISSAISASTSALTVLLHSDYDANASGSTSITAGITSNGSTITLRGGSGTINTASAFDNLTIDTTGNAVSLSQALDVNGNFTITAGTFQAQGNQMNVSGNWSNSGTFTHGNNTVILDGANQIISGSSTFYNLTKQNSSNDSTNDTLTFTSGTTTTINNNLTLDGLDANDMLLIRASVASAATINFTGASTFTGDYLDVEYSTLTDNSSGITLPINPANSTNTGNTTGWFRGNLDHFGWAVIPSQTAGASFTVVITAYDADGNVTTQDTDGTAFTNSESVTFSSTATAAASGTVPTYNADDLTDGTTVSVDLSTGSFTTSNILLYKSSETPTITITHNTKTGTSGSITVNPAALSSFIVSGITNPIIAETSSNVSVIAYDAYQNIKTNYSGTIQFSSTDGASVLPGNYTFVGGDQGAHSFINGVTFNTGGTQSVTVSDGAVSGTQGNITVIALPPSSSLTNSIINSVIQSVVNTLTIPTAFADPGPVFSQPQQSSGSESIQSTQTFGTSGASGGSGNSGLQIQLPKTTFDFLHDTDPWSLFGDERLAKGTRTKVICYEGKVYVVSVKEAGGYDETGVVITGNMKTDIDGLAVPKVGEIFDETALKNA